MKPTRKVTVGGAAGAAATVIVWFLGEVGTDVPGEVGAAIATLLAFAGSFLAADASE
jgi:putative flippase GtrA